MRSRMAKDFFVLRFVKIFLICSWFSVNCAGSPTRTRYWHQIHAINIQIHTRRVGTMNPTSTAPNNNTHITIPKTAKADDANLLTPEVIAEQEQILQNIQRSSVHPSKTWEHQWCRLQPFRILSDCFSPNQKKAFEEQNPAAPSGSEGHSCRSIVLR